MVSVNYGYELQSRVGEFTSQRIRLVVRSQQRVIIIYSWSTLPNFLSLSLAPCYVVSRSAKLFRYLRFLYGPANPGHRRRHILATDRADRDFDIEAEKPLSSKNLGWKSNHLPTVVRPTICSPKWRQGILGIGDLP